MSTENDFLQAEIHVSDARHLVFATETMLQHLKMAKSWYGDGTFKIVSSCPFTQLFSICFFAKKDDAMKQLPGCFVLMTRKRKRDYRAVSY